MKLKNTGYTVRTYYVRYKINNLIVIVQCQCLYANNISLSVCVHVRAHV